MTRVRAIRASEGVFSSPLRLREEQTLVVVVVVVVVVAASQCESRQLVP
jgi:hypothetical protein